jgi:hypothetical protein
LISIILSDNIEFQLEKSGTNRSEIQSALTKVPKQQKSSIEWLISNMPREDLETLSSDFLLTHTDLAFKAWNSAPWKNEVPEDIFLDNILPYANLNEKREEWRFELRNTFIPYIQNISSPSEAVVVLNKIIFKKLGVIYSTQRPKADQSPSESILAGMASCTGLSILLINTCRSLGIPARFVGTSSWYNDSGNHSWVEVWDNGWHYTGAAEPVDDLLNVGWFDNNASKATKGDYKYGIFAVTWNYSDLSFPMDWLPEDKTYGAVDVTNRYNGKKTPDLVTIGFRIFDENGFRRSEKITVNGPNNYCFNGKTKGELNDLNDCLTLVLPRNEEFTIDFNNKSKKILSSNDLIIDLIID